MKEYSAEIERLGAELKSKRDKKNLTLEAASVQLKIQPAYIEAIEEGKIELLPTGFYRKSFIKEYCALLGARQLGEAYIAALAGVEESISAEKAAEQLKQQKESKSGNELVRDREYKAFNARPLLIAAVVLLVLGVGAIFLFKPDISSKAKGNGVMQLSGGTEVIIKEKEAEDKKREAIAEEKARKLAEERAKAEEEQLSAEKEENAEATANADGTAENASVTTDRVEKAEDAQKELKLAKNVLYISAPEQDVTIKVSQDKIPVYEGLVHKGKAMRFKVEGELPVRVRYENPNKTEVIFGGTEFKPLHPSNQGRSRYYWSDGTVTFTANKQQR